MFDAVCSISSILQSGACATLSIASCIVVWLCRSDNQLSELMEQTQLNPIRYVSFTILTLLPLDHCTKDSTPAWPPLHQCTTKRRSKMIRDIHSTLTIWTSAKRVPTRLSSSFRYSPFSHSRVRQRLARLRSFRPRRLEGRVLSRPRQR